ncbi:MAG: hypothetical protein P1U58_14865 [Verrucomicrobiales bacterium]|nr:hypothetical protein [Verrucomicrobiales bacterium]
MIRLICCVLLVAPVCFAETSIVQWDSLEMVEQRGLIAEFDESRGVKVVAGEPDSNHDYAWVSFDHPDGQWDLSLISEITATIKNGSENETEVMLWVCAANGWSAVGGFGKLVPGEAREFNVNLHECYPDKTPKIDPQKVNRLQIMVRRAAPDLDLDVSSIVLRGKRGEVNLPEGRVIVPEIEKGAPSPGRRVRYRLAGDENSGIYSVLYLPPSWEKGSQYPVIVEYPGNIFLNRKCYSTGLPDQCVIGYGMTKGKGVIILSLPFLDRTADRIIESGFGNIDDTTAYAKSAIEEVIEKFGGDRDNMVLTGFSRGSIACGFIGLRDDEIASYWKGIHGCQHYDGSSWRESKMEEAVERAKRFQGIAIFQTDNDRKKYAPLVATTDPSVEWTWAKSGLGFHATAMFLDDRPSTVQLREWFRLLIASR